MGQSLWIYILQICFLAHVSIREVSTEKASANLQRQYAKNPRDIIDLANLEVGIARKLAPIFLKIAKANQSHQRHCHQLLLSYLSEYEKDNQVITNNLTAPRDVALVSENPLLTMRMIRRFINILLSDNIGFCGSIRYEIRKVIDSEFESKNVEKPSSNDLNEALEGVLFLHFIYDLNVQDQLRLGNLKGINTKVHLNFDDCVTLTFAAFQKSWAVLALEWLECAKVTALNANGQIGLKESLTIKSLEIKKENFKGRVSFDDFHKNENGERQPYVSGLEDLQGIDELCLGGTILETESLNCIYDHDHAPYFAISPLKKEIISKDPSILLYHDFATEREIESIKKFTSDDVLEFYAPENEILKRLKRKIQLFTGLVVNHEDTGSFQKTLHTPLGLFEQMEKSYIEDIERRKHGAFTIHLNQVQVGGNIVFSKIKQFAQPVKGSAIFWSNFDSRGNPDSRLYHKHCPVIYGSKQTVVYPLDVPPEMILKCD